MENKKLITLAKPNLIKERRNLLKKETNLSKDYLKSIKRYSFSLEKVNNLNKNIEYLNNYKKKLKEINKTLEQRKDKTFPEYISNSNQNSKIVADFIDQTKEKGYQIALNKVYRITGNMSSTHLLTINYYYTNGQYLTQKSPLSETQTSTKSFEYYLDDKDFMETIQYILIDEGQAGAGAIIKTTYNEFLLKPDNISFSKDDYPLKKEFKIILDWINWEEHYAKYNGKDGWYMASISNLTEMMEVVQLAWKYGLWKVFTGGHRKYYSNGQPVQPINGRDENIWWWADGSKFAGVENLFNGREPNNYRNIEAYLEIYTWVGRFNDISIYRRQPAVYSKMTEQFTSQTVSVSSDDEQITPGINNDISEKYTVDEDKIKLADNFLQIISDFQNNINLDIQTIQNIINDNNNKLILIDTNINRMNEQITKINDLNNLTENFSNISNNNFFDNVINNIKKIFLIEGFTSNFYDKAEEKHDEFIVDKTKELNETRDYESLDDNYLLKLEKQQDTIFSNVLNDYIDNKNGSSLKKVYNNLEQDNILNKRLINIEEYKIKKHTDYINILKLSVLSITIIAILLILNKKGLLPKNLTYAVIIAIVISLTIYSLVKIIYINLRDKKDYNKEYIPVDREYIKHQLDISNNNRFDFNLDLDSDSGFNLGTCINDDCCNENMKYDSINKKCLMQEEFHNIFDTFRKNEAPSNISYNNLLEDKSTYGFLKEPFVETINDAAEMKNKLIIDSLLNSETDRFNKIKAKDIDNLK